MTEEVKKLCARIRKIRVSKGFNQLEMGNRLGLTASAYAKIERANTDPQTSRLFEIASILKVDVLSFFRDEETAAQSKAISNNYWETVQKQLSAMQKEIADLKTVKIINNKKRK